MNEKFEKVKEENFEISMAGNQSDSNFDQPKQIDKQVVLGELFESATALSSELREIK